MRQQGSSSLRNVSLHIFNNLIGKLSDVCRHDYKLAKLLYEKANEYQPGNEKLSLRYVVKNTGEFNEKAKLMKGRITEMAMLMEGHLSRPDSSSTTLSAPVKRSRALDPIGESGTQHDGSKRFKIEQ